MIRKATRIIAVVLVLVLALTSTTFAWHADSVQAPSQRQMRTLTIMVDSANAAISRLTDRAIATPYDDVDCLLWMIQLITTPVFLYADAIGATVICEYETYYIDGQYVEVDPLMVIN